MNIGEQHYTSDSGFNDFLKFLENLVKKNLYLNQCLDFIYEESPYSIRKPDDPYFQDKQRHELSLNKVEKQDATLVYLRKSLNTRDSLLPKGFRVHDTDIRLTLKGFNASLIKLLVRIEQSTEKKFIEKNNLYVIIAAYIYEFYDERYTLMTREYIEGSIWKFFILLRDKPDLYLYNLYTEKSNIGVQLDKFIEKNKKIDMINLKYLVGFVNSVSNYIQDTLNYSSFFDITADDDFSKCSRAGYYKYLRTKKSRMAIEKNLLINSYYDKKFKKQLENIDRTYFKDDPKTFIFVYFFMYRKKKNVNVSTFYEIQTVCRMFRKFDTSKKRFKSCDDGNKSMRNIIAYSGNYHTIQINKFLVSLPHLKLKPNPRDMSDLFFAKEWIISRKDLRYQEKVLPTNVDYFQYDEKIINQLKKQYNVIRYTQLMNKEITNGKKSVGRPRVCQNGERRVYRRQLGIRKRVCVEQSKIREYKRRTPCGTNEYRRYYKNGQDPKCVERNKPRVPHHKNNIQQQAQSTIIKKRKTPKNKRKL